MIHLLKITTILIAYSSFAFAADIPVRFGYPSGANGQLAKVLEQAKLPEKHGIAGQFTFFQYGPPLLEALAAGQIDVVFTSLVPAASYLAKQPGELTIIAQPGNTPHSIVVRNESPIQKLSDFRGKKIGLSLRTESHLDLLRALKAEGLEPGKDVELVNFPPAELVSAYEQNLVDGILIRQPAIFKVTDQLGGRIVQSWPHQYIVAVRTELLKQQPDLKEKLLASIKDGLFYISEHRAEAAKWWGEHLKLKPELVERSSQSNPAYNVVSAAAAPAEVSAEFRENGKQVAKDLVTYGLQKNEVVFVYE